VTIAGKIEAGETAGKAYDTNALITQYRRTEEAQAAQSALPRKTDWPYIPTPNDSWYGQFHSVGRHTPFLSPGHRLVNGKGRPPGQYTHHVKRSVYWMNPYAKAWIRGTKPDNSIPLFQ